MPAVQELAVKPEEVAATIRAARRAASRYRRRLWWS
jgi:hypothetical protein